MKQITFSGWPENDMLNMTFREHPVIAARKQRNIEYHAEGIQGMTAGNDLCMARNGRLYVGSHAVDMQLSDGEKELLLLGEELLVLPDKKVLSMCDLTWSTAELLYQAEFTCSLCDRQGRVYTLNYTQPPTNPVKGEYWVDSTVSPPVLRQFGPNENWLTVKDTCIRLEGGSVGRYFRVGDGVVLNGEKLKGETVVRAKSTGYIVVDGIIGQSITDSILVERSMPQMDLVTVCGDRFWGCHRGEGVSTIYCSRSGSCSNWLPVDTADTGPWRTEVASSGSFTGAVAFGKTPVFFKEGWLHKVTGTDSGNFRVETVPCVGVRPGCENSLAVADGKLYYCSHLGIMEYTGSGVPRCILPGDFREAWAGALGSSYYVCVNLDGHPQLLVYDAEKGIWCREDELRARHFTAWQGGMYCVSGKQCINLRSGSGDEGPVQWYLESDTLCVGENQLLRRLEVCLDLDGQVMLSISWDGGKWEPLGEAPVFQGRLAFTVNTRCRACSHFRLRLDGTEGMRLYSIKAELIG